MLHIVGVALKLVSYGMENREKQRILEGSGGLSKQAIHLCN